MSSKVVCAKLWELLKKADNHLHERFGEGFLSVRDEEELMLLLDEMWRSDD